MYLPEPKVGKDFSVIVAILSNAIRNWTEFDAWALSKGFDPLEIPSRRLMAAAWLFLTEPMDQEQKENLIDQLYAEDYQEAKKNEIKEAPEKEKIVLAPKEKWRAPKGWRPPGWDDEQAYRNGVNFMSNKPG